MAGYRLGIDFGTSSTVAFLRWPDGRSRPLLFDGSPLLPSAVYLDEDRLLVGRDALHTARVNPERFEPNPKQRIDDGHVLLGHTEVPVTQLIAAVLRRVGQEASQVAGGEPISATLACPAAWAEHRRAVLLDAAAAAGIAAPALISEPIATARYFDAVVRDRNRPTGNLIVYDLGAGTFDVSVVARAPDGFVVRVAEGLSDLGGLDIDATVIAYLGAVGQDHADTWNRLEQPRTAADLRARRQLWEDARTAKEMLSRASSTVIYVPLVEQDVLLGRPQFERLVRPVLDRTVAATRSALRRAAVEADKPLDVFLVGGSSRIPLIATLLHQALGVAPTAIEQPELAVAEGCLMATQPPAAPQPPPVGAPLVPPVAAPLVPPVAAPLVPPSPVAGPLVPARPPQADQLAWPDLVQVIDFVVGERAGYTLRCYLPARERSGEPEPMFLSRRGRLLVFDELSGLCEFVRTTFDHDLAELDDWDVVSERIDAETAEDHVQEAYELDLVAANLQADYRQWVPEVYVGAGDLALELDAALRIDEVTDAFAEGFLLAWFDAAMRAEKGRTDEWWTRQRLRRDEVTAIRETWLRVIAAIEARVVVNPS